MDLVTGFDAFLGSLLVQLAHVHHHGPSLGLQGLGLGLHGGLDLARPEQFKGGFASQAQ